MRAIDKPGVMLRHQPDVVHPLIKLVGATVAAGFPSPAQDFSEEEIDLIREFGLDKPSVFIMKVSGPSMEGTDIHIPAGALVSVDRSKKAKPGDVVVAALNGEFLIKTLARVRGQWILHSENPQFRPIKIEENDQLVIWGVVGLVLYNAQKRR